MDHNDQRDYAEEQYNRAEMEREGLAELAAEQDELQRATPREIPSVTQWACQCCLLMMANGECCDRPDHGGQEGNGEGKEPLSEIPSGAHTSLGMMYEEHSDDCLRHTLGSDAPSDYECDCERRTFSWSRCDGCGSNLGGERHAFIIWTPATNTVA